MTLPLAISLGLVCATDPFYPFFNNSELSLILGCAATGYAVQYFFNRDKTEKVLGFDVSGIMKDFAGIEGAIEGAVVGLAATFASGNPLLKGAIGFGAPFIYEKLL